MQITLDLPDTLFQPAQSLGHGSNPDVQVALRSSLEALCLILGQTSQSALLPPVATLSDPEVLTLAATKLSLVQSDRLHTLQTQGKATGLTELEQYELFSLLYIYQLGQLRKSEALAEAVQRGLRSPLSP
ncbi:MAG: hypothetical protein ACO34J_06350 [Prochlorothrix sp.]